MRADFAESHRSDSMHHHILFAPVSSARGMGEYARCLSLARAVERRWPQLRSHFLLSREAPYASSAPFETHLLPASVTLCGAEVDQVIDRLRPSLVVFDNAGSSRHLRAAHRAGARVIYVSSRQRQRRRAFRWQWLPMLDEVWLAYPPDLFSRLSWLERAKLRIAGRTIVRALDTILPGDPTTDPASVATDAAPILFMPGGGSTHGAPGNLPALFARLAERLARRGERVSFVAGPGFTSHIDSLPTLQVLRNPSGDELREQLGAARLVIANGGDSLLQALVLGRPCIAMPIASDQASRIAWCQSRGIVATGTADELPELIERHLAEPGRRAALAANATGMGWRDGMAEALRAIGRLTGVEAATDL